MPICTASATRATMEVPAADGRPGTELQMNNETGLFQRIVDWLTEALERAQAHDRDRYVEQSLNAREASQRIHRLEHETGTLQG
jgi:hypothetical protein